MLFVHPASTCDVCLDPYSWTTASDTPHAIACGHVFCLRCLQCTTPHNCPLCRKAYLPERAKRLHVDKFVAEIGQEDDTTRILSFLYRLARCCGDDVERDRAGQIMEEVESWITNHEETEGLYKTLRASLAALKCYNKLLKATEEQAEQHEEHIRIVQAQLAKKEHMEMHLTRINLSLEHQLSCSEELRDDLALELQRVRNQHSRLANQLAEYRDKPNRLPTPPRPSSFDPWVASAAPPPGTDPRHTLSNTTNVVDQSGPPVNAFYPYASPAQPAETPQVSIRTPTVGERKKKPRPWFRPPIIVPGASESEKVVPPKPSDPSKEFEAWGAAFPSNTEPLRDESPQNDEPAVQDQSITYDHPTPRPEGSFMAPAPQSPPYGFVQGVGYVHRESPPTAPPSDNPLVPSIGQLMLYDRSSQPQEATNTRARTVQAAAQVMNAPGEIYIHPAHPPDRRRRDPDEGRVIHRQGPTPLAIAQGLRLEPLNPLLRSTYRPSGPGNPALPSQPTAPVRAASAAAHITNGSPDAPGVDTSPEPSAASSVLSWGTSSSQSTRSSHSRRSSHSARVSQTSGLSNLNLTGLPLDTPVEPPSQSSSLADLGLSSLPGLPNVSTVSVDSEDDEASFPRVLPGVRMPDRARDSFMMNAPPLWGSSSAPVRTPAANSGHLSDGHNASTTQEPEDLPGPSGLALLETPSLSRSQVSGHGDLQQVNRSLVRLAAESRRRPQHSSTTDTRGGSSSRSRSRDGIYRRDVGSASSAEERVVAPLSSIYRSNSGSSRASHGDRNFGPHTHQGTFATTEPNSDRSRRRHSAAHSISSLASALLPSRRSSMRGRADERPGSMANNDEARGRYSLHTGSASSTHSRPRSRSRDLERYSSTFPASVGIPGSALSGSSLLLYVPPSGPSTSSAATSTGEPSSIHAPRPVNGGHNPSFLSLLSSRHR